MKRKKSITVNIQSPQIMDGAINNIGHNFKS